MSGRSIRPEEAVRRVLPLPPQRRGQALRGMLRERPDVLARALDLLPTAASAARSPLAEAAPSPAEPRVGPYRLRSVLGEGGFGVVWLATQEEPVRRSVALKILRPDRLDAGARGRFDQERRLLAMLAHPALVKVFEAGETQDGRPWFSMELAEGAPITEAADAARLPVRDRVRLLGEVARAVHHAHEHGLVHRDLKPANVLLAFEGDRASVKVIDFGVAHAVFEPADPDRRAGSLVGTPDFLPPELLRLHTLAPTASVDVFALGVLLRRLVAGGDLGDRRAGLVSALDAIDAAMRETVAVERCETVGSLRRTLRGDLDAIASRCIADDPRGRYGSALELAQDLDRFLRGEPVLARGNSFVYHGAMSARRHATALAAAALVAVTALAAFLWSWHERSLAMRARDEAQIRTRQVHQAHAFIFELLSEILRMPATSTAAPVEILTEASRLAGPRLASDPEQEAEVRVALGHLWLGLGRSAEARREFARSRQLEGTELDPETNLEIRLAESRSFRMAGQAVEAMDAAQAALLDARATHPEDPDEVARALIEVARVESLRGDRMSAARALANAARLLDTVSEASDPVRQELERALRDLGPIRTSEPAP